ncbi:hypothetical protein JI664_05300 [Rhodobacter sp. NTK016B]|uniref:hypothetical protein n=1 Tax=Rhodobacter sp. NTK016B TaxID=2759676 RepID=UPI001A8FD02E|nr:hypothetical protein [Rhodobacter sp. NTK016B]MBN8291369.1 hypothetical protein [Rhodobacter sp. NTK016B]
MTFRLFLATAASLALTLPAAPAQADLSVAEQSELSRLGQSFLEQATEPGAGERLARMRALIAAGRAGHSGTLSLGAFPGALAPLAGPVAISERADYALVCDTEVEIGQAQTGPTRTRERLELRHVTPEIIAFSLSTSGAATHLRLDGRSNGAQTALARWRYSGPEGRMDVVPIGRGVLYRDDISRAVLAPQQPHRQVIDDTLLAVVSGNPTWFMPATRVALGQPWLGVEADDAGFPQVMALLEPFIGAGAAFTDIDIVSAVSGQHRMNKRDGLVVEYVGQLAFDLPDTVAPSQNLRFALLGHEVYDVETLARMESRFDIVLLADGAETRLAQSRDCVFN